LKTAALKLLDILLALPTLQLLLFCLAVAFDGGGIESLPALMAVLTAIAGLLVILSLWVAILLPSAVIDRVGGLRRVLGAAISLGVLMAAGMFVYLLVFHAGKPLDALRVFTVSIQLLGLLFSAGVGIKYAKRMRAVAAAAA